MKRTRRQDENFMSVPATSVPTPSGDCEERLIRNPSRRRRCRGTPYVPPCDRELLIRRMNERRRTNRASKAQKEDVLRKAVHSLLDMMIEEESFLIAREMGRQLRWGEVDLVGTLCEPPPELKTVDSPGADIFGQPITKKYSFECECPKCHRTLAAVRFAPHLEKCMGMGRNSSRIANRRLAAIGSSSQPSNSQGSDTSAKTQSNGSASQNQTHSDFGSEDDHFEDEDDEEWTMEKKRKSKKSYERSQTKTK